MLPPDAVEHLQNELAQVEGQKFCTPGEAPERIRLALFPIRPSGAIIRSWGFEVALNHKGSPLFELDSTIDGIVLNPRDAARAGVKPLTTAAKGKNYLAVADNIDIGGLHFKDCVVRVALAPELAGANSLIGTNFFRDHLIHIDYVDKAVTLSPLPAAGAAAEKGWSPAFTVGANLFLPATLGTRGPVLFALDTGAEYTVLAPALVTPGSKHMELNPEVQGYSGDIVKVVVRYEAYPLGHSPVFGADGKLLPAYSIFYRPMLHFAGNDRLVNEPRVFDITAKSHAAGTEISGLLGFDILYDYFLDLNYRDSLVKIDMDLKHQYQERTERRLQ